MIFLASHISIGPWDNGAFDRAGFDLRIGRKEQARPFHPPLRLARVYLRIGCVQIHFFVLRVRIVRNHTYACTMREHSRPADDDWDDYKKCLRYLKTNYNTENYYCEVKLCLYKSDNFIIIFIVVKKTWKKYWIFLINLIFKNYILSQLSGIRKKLVCKIMLILADASKILSLILFTKYMLQGRFRNP